MPSDYRSSAPVRADLLPTALRVCRLLLLALYIGLALLGIPATPPATLLAASAVGATTAALLAASCYSLAERWPAGRTLAVTGLTAAASLPFAAGIRLLGGAGGFLGLVVLALATIVAGHAVQTLEAPSAGRTPAAAPPTAAEDITRDLLAALPLQMLLQERRDAASEIDRRRDGPHRAAAVQLHSAVVLELIRRDHDGMQDWLNAGAQGPPEPYLRGPHDLTGQ